MTYIRATIHSRIRSRQQYCQEEEFNAIPQHTSQRYIHIRGHGFAKEHRTTAGNTDHNGQEFLGFPEIVRWGMDVEQHSGGLHRGRVDQNRSGDQHLYWSDRRILQ